MAIVRVLNFYTDSGPDCRNPRRIHRARKLLSGLREPDVKLFFRTGGAGRFHPPGSDLECPAVYPVSVRFHDPFVGGIALPWDRLASLDEYAAHEDVSPNAWPRPSSAASLREDQASASAASPARRAPAPPTPA